MAWAKALKSAVCYIDQRFAADEELLYWQHRLKTLRFRSLISGLTVAVFWAYLELQTVEAPPVEDLDLQTILHLLGALLFAIAAFLSLTEINLEVLWLPLACMYCGLMSQLRCEPHLRVLSVAFATLVASFTLPLRAASLWLVYLTAATAFLVSDISQEVKVASGSVAMNAVLLLLLCSFYHAFWRAEAEHRKAFVAGERVQAMCLSPKDSNDEVAEESLHFAVLSLEADLSIQCCGDRESRFFGFDLNGQYLMDLVSMEDQHMIGLLARTDSANRTILVNVVKPGHHTAQMGNESLKFRLLPTGLQSPKWLGFFAQGTSVAAAPGGAAPNAGSSSMSVSHTSRASVASMVSPTTPRVVLPAVPQGDPPLSPTSPTSPRPEVAPPSSPLPMTPIRSRNSQRSNRSIESKNSLQVVDGRKQRQASGTDLMGGSPGLRLRQMSSENPETIPRHQADALDFHEASHSLAVRQDPGLISNSVLSLSWSIGTEQYRSSLLGHAPKSLSDAQTQTEVSWTTTSGWKCRNCQKPPKPPGESQGHQTQADGDFLRQKLQRLQGCWLLRSGPKQCVGWLQGFVVRGVEVTTTSGAMTLENDDDGQLYLSGGLLYVDQDDVLHRTGKSGGTYLYARVTEQHLVNTQLKSAQSVQSQQAQILRPNVRHQSWNSVISIAH
eukprot:s284_g25.t1